jgi:type II secretory pathway pseudopilin PulG
MSKTRKDSPDQAKSAASGHKVVTGVIVALVVLVVFVLLTAFVWPGWATHSSDQQAGSTSQTTQQSTENDKPKVAAKALPNDAQELLKAMPDAVGAYSRQDVTDSQNWASASPLEEHTIVYTTGDSANDVTLLVAQWAKADNAKTQYDALIGTLTGEKIAAGNVKVSGSNTGAYEVHEEADNAKKAVAVWQNDTCVFQINGNTTAVKAFYQKFPL